MSRTGFSGQTWKVHPSQGIDFDVYVLADAPQQALVGHWSHGWHPGNDANQFREANHKPKFEESQYILRVRSEQGFRVVVVAWPKGKRPQDLAVGTAGKDITITAGGKQTQVTPSGEIIVR